MVAGPREDPGAPGRALLAAGDVPAALEAWGAAVDEGPRWPAGPEASLDPGLDPTLAVAVELATTALGHLGRGVDRAALARVERRVRAYILRVQAAFPPTEENRRALAPVEAAHRALVGALGGPPAPRARPGPEEVRVRALHLLRTDPRFERDRRVVRTMTGVGIALMAGGALTIGLNMALLGNGGPRGTPAALFPGLMALGGTSIAGGLATFIGGRVVQRRAYARAKDQVRGGPRPDR